MAPPGGRHDGCRLRTARRGVRTRASGSTSSNTCRRCLTSLTGATPGMMWPMRLTHTMTYDASPAEVGAMLDDPAYRDEVIAAQGSLRGTASFEQDGDTVVVVVDQVQPADGIPGFAKKFVGDEINIVQREEWTSVDRADLRVTIPGKPGHMVGSIELAGDGGTTTETVDVEITVNIPLVGGRLEKLIGDLLRKALRDEERVAHDYLSR